MAKANLLGSWGEGIAAEYLRKKRYQIVACNFLFPEKYEEMYNTIIATYAQMGTFDNNMMDMMKTLMRSYLFSPIPVLITQVLASIFTYGFYGLFVALGTKREADIFDNTTEDDE